MEQRPLTHSRNLTPPLRTLGTLRTNTTILLLSLLYDSIYDGPPRASQSSWRRAAPYALSCVTALATV
ncbi:hypothetical protein E2C01_083546 [Portunus trituberculatus]|uniref:Uncharacterized protein n=1 Tax=Portunus trituberculatus TaxID=210409 RepID=A0A5B7IVH3_PORTR|nr:hypothetical protein [Portunus trituberculatus]